MTTYFANPGDNLQTKVAALSPGDTLYLNDGTYVSSGSTPCLRITNTAGTAVAPITIAALHDGQVILDGLSGSAGNNEPIFVSNASYIVVEGMIARNSYGPVVFIYGGPTGGGPCDHITLRRITAHGTGNGNNHVFSLMDGTITNVLVEDCAAWGPGRYMFGAYHCGAGIVFRRCYAYWNTITDAELAPRACFNVYGSSGVILENCIGRHSIPYHSEGFSNYFTATYQTSDGPATNNTSWYGCIFYDNYEGFWLNNFGGSGTTWKDCYFETPQPANTSYTGTPYGDGFTNNGNTGAQAMTNCTFSGCLVGFNGGGSSGSLSVTNCAFNGNTKAMQGGGSGHTHCGFYNNGSLGVALDSTDLTSNPGFQTVTYGRGGKFFIPYGSPYQAAGSGGGDIGANILYQYVNGTLTGTPLWPWPMESRVVAELGQSPTYASSGGPWTTLTGLYSTPFPLVQSATGGVGGSNANSVTVTTSATGSGNLLVAFVMVQGASVTITPPSGWTQVSTTQGIAGGTGSVAMFYRQNSAPGVTSHIFSFSASCNAAVAFEEWSGVATSNALDQEVAKQNAKSTSVLTGTTPSLADPGELAIFGLAVPATNVLTYSSITNGYIEDMNANATSSRTSKAQATLFYKAGVGAPTTSSGATMSGTGAAGNTTILAVFRVAGTGTALTGECDGIGTLIGTLSLTGGTGTALTGECDGIGTLIGTLSVPATIRGTYTVVIGGVLI